MKTILFLLFLFYVATGLPCLVTAAPLPVGDASFEGNALGPGDYWYDLGPEWAETDGPGNTSGFEEYITGFAADGTDHLGMGSGHDVWQDPGASYEAGTRYTLTVAAGNRPGSTNPGNQTQYLLADSAGVVYATGIFDASAVPSGSFGDAPAVVFDTLTDPAAVGKSIRILLQARGAGRSHFDNVRLTALPLIPPGGATLSNQPATAVTSTTATLHGRVESAGDSAPSITLYWGTGDGGADAGAWQNSLALPGTHTGSFSGNITDLAAGTTYYFTARGTNSAGISWATARGTFETSPSPPSVANVAASAIKAVSAVVGATVTAGGGGVTAVTLYHGTADGGTTPAAWGGSLSLSPVEGEVVTALTGLAPATAYYFRAYAENSGGGAWAAATATFSTPAVAAPAVENRPADGITGTTASLRGEVTEEGNDPPVITVFYGTADGGTNPEGWASSLGGGRHGGGFSLFAAGLNPTTTYYFRCRATNAAATTWAPDTFTFTTTTLEANSAVINEIHYRPADKTSVEDFIELHNPGDTALDLTGWTLSDAVTFAFPAAATLPAKGFLIVAENPGVILAKYGKTALGPWTGKLNSSGERIDLKDASAVLRDRVQYGVGFPWPTGSAGAGGSAELIHPGLDNDIGGSWRTSGSAVSPPVAYIAAGSSAWKYLKGTAEASTPVDAWRAPAFDDAAWAVGAAGIGYGYGGVGHGTTVTDMRRESAAVPGYASLYFRKSFTVPADAVPERLRLRISIDDGCVIWINGHEVDRRHVPDGQLAYNQLATNHTRVWEETIINGADDILLGGTNVIAVHGFNTSLTSSDFSMDLELFSGSGDSSFPTPGAVNSVSAALSVIPPQIRQVDHAPRSPVPGEGVAITAKITDPDGMGAVTLAYQTVDPGSYIRLTDAAYATSWTTVPMRDDGLAGDAAAGDSTFSVLLPAGLQTHRRLVRYRIAMADASGNSLTVPYADDEQPNFAYYVSSPLPDWQGAFRPGATPLRTFPAGMLDDLPVYSLIANGTDVINSQYTGGSDAVRFRGTFVYDGKVFDHIEFRNRGEASTYVSGKNKWRFYFNRARDLPAKNNFGEDYGESWGSFSGDACASPWAAVHRGMAGVEEATSYRVYQLAGLPSPHTHYYHFRIVRGATETPPAGTVVNDPIGNADGQYAGDFWGLYLAVEQPDGSFLDERGLPDGNLYKIENNSGDKKNQFAGVSPNQPVDSSDWDAFRDAHVSANPSEAWWRANMDMDAYYSFHAINRLIGNVDLRYGYNHYFYHRSSDNRWVPVPWDLDMMFIPKNHWSGIIDANKSITQHPALAVEYRNRAREILDLLASDADSGGGQLGQLIDEFASIVNPAGQALTWADADAAMWNLHPRTNGSDGLANGQTNHRGNFYRTSFADSRIGGGWTRWLRSPAASGTMEHEDTMIYLRDYATNAWPGGAWAVNNGNQLGYGFQFLLSDSTDAAIPQRPVATPAGDPAFPAADLAFRSSAFVDPQGPASYAKTQWRLAEISGPGVPGYTAGTPRTYEIQPDWTFESTAPPGDVTIPNGVAAPGKTYRVRVRHQDNTGRWSRWSSPSQFLVTTPPPGLLLHYWNFNADDLLAATRTLGGGTLLVTGTFEAGNGQNFAGENARDGDPAGDHLRVNTPLGATVDWRLPTIGHENIVVHYETRRSGQGAGSQSVSYTTDGITFAPFATITVPDGAPLVQTLDFRHLPAVENNPRFAVRITFTQGDGGSAGNNRFDNLTVEGEALPVQPGTYAFWRAAHFPDPADAGNNAVSGPEANPAGDGISNLVRYAHGAGPRGPLPQLLPTLGINGGVYQFRFRFDPALTDLVWKVEASNDLSGWPRTLFDSAVGALPPLEDGWLSVDLPASLSAGPSPDPRIFLRLKLQLAP